jgi:hypothetical protein
MVTLARAMGSFRFLFNPLLALRADFGFSGAMDTSVAFRFQVARRRGAPIYPAH